MPETGAIAGWVLAPLLSAVVGYLLAYIRGRWKDSGDYHDNMREGMGVLLRQQLIDYHRRFVEQEEPAAVSDAEQLTAIYAAYHNLGFNGTGTKLYQDTFNRMKIRED